MVWCFTCCCKNLSRICFYFFEEKRSEFLCSSTKDSSRTAFLLFYQEVGENMAVRLFPTNLCPILAVFCGEETCSRSELMVFSWKPFECRLGILIVNLLIITARLRRPQARNSYDWTCRWSSQSWSQLRPRAHSRSECVLRQRKGFSEFQPSQKCDFRLTPTCRLCYRFF